MDLRCDLNEKHFGETLNKRSSFKKQLTIVAYTTIWKNDTFVWWKIIE